MKRRKTPLEKRQFTIELERLGCRRVEVKNHMLPQGVKEYVPEEKENQGSIGSISPGIIKV